MTKKRFAILVVFVAISLVLFALWYRGGSEPSKAYVDITTGKPSRFGARLFYRGLKIPGTPLIVFKRYYAIAEKDPHTGLTTGVDYRGEGYNHFFVFYDDGNIAAHGLCMVEKNNDQILHDVHNLKEAQFFHPEGELVSSVEGGTGVQTLFFGDGTKYWELQLEDFGRRKLTIWNRDGSVKLEKTY